MRSIRLLVFMLLALLFTLALAPAAANPASQSGDTWPVMGMNLYAISYYDNVIYFTDATRHASDWLSFNPDSNEWSDERAIPREENGYPASLAADQAARMVVFIDSVVAPAGNYTLTWRGSGELRVVYNGSNTETFATGRGDHRQVVNVLEHERLSLWLEILATDPVDPVRDLRLWLPGYDETSEAIFTPWVLEDLAAFSPLRPSFWNWINESEAGSWSQRSRMTWSSWGVETGPFGGGVPYEVMIELANATDSDFWLNVPHAADDDYVRQLASLIRERLDPSLRVWVEYTNEHWNPLFSQNWWLFEQSESVAAEERLEDYFLFHHYGRRSGQVLQIFEEVFADDSARVIGIVGGLSDWHLPAEAALMEMERQGTVTLVDALAVAPYIGNYAEDGSWNLDALVSAIGPEFNEADYALIFEELHRAVDAMYIGESEYAMGMQNNRALAEQYGLAFIGYEGGQHLTAYDLAGEGFSDTVDEFVGIYNQVNARPEMYDLYMDWLQGWAKFGGQTLVPFHYAGSWSEVETFGHLAYAGQPLAEAHKFRALIDWLATQSG